MRRTIAFDDALAGATDATAALAEARVGLDRVRQAAAHLPHGQRRLVSWVARDLIDAMVALQSASGPASTGEAHVEVGRVCTHLADLVELTSPGRTPGRRPDGDFDLAFRDAETAGDHPEAPLLRLTSGR